MYVWIWLVCSLVGVGLGDGRGWEGWDGVVLRVRKLGLVDTVCEWVCWDGGGEGWVMRRGGTGRERAYGFVTP